MLRWTLPATLALGLGGCPGFGDKTLAEIEGITEVPTYEADIKPILAEYCTVCHTDPPVAGAPQPLLTYAQVAGEADRVHVRGVQLGDMPPNGGLPDTERAIIDAWFLGGTPEGTVVDPQPEAEPEAQPEPEPEPEGPPTWATIERLMTAPGCANSFCHGGDAPSAGLDLTSYAGFIAADGGSGVLTGDGDPAASVLIDRLRARNGTTVMPVGGPALPDAEIAIFEAWIAAGFPEE